MPQAVVTKMNFVFNKPSKTCIVFISGGLCNRRNKLTYCLVKDRHIESSGIERSPIGFECFSLTFPGERTVMKVISAFLSWRNRVRYLDD